LHRIASSCLAAVVLAAVPASAEIYRWTDDDGRVHFTQDLSQVPARYRSQAEQGAKQDAGGARVQTYSRGADADAPEPARAAPDEGAQGEKGGQSGQVWRIPVQRAGTGMVVAVRINNAVTAPFLIDTGASDVLLPQAVASRLGLELDHSRTKRYATANGVVEQPVVMLHSVSLGGATAENVPASVSPDMDLGLLGLSFFNHFTYNIDTAAGVVTLRRNDLAESGQIRGGRSEAQWRSEYAGLRARQAEIERDVRRLPSSRSRELERLEAERAEVDRQLSLLETEADGAHVPMSWRE
jgi:clan AA aspartic protease (TIGR02281 family)